MPTTPNSPDTPDAPAKSSLLVALAGQQNAGKSTVFNMLTGANQYVANYPGVTVEKKTGRYKDGEVRVEVVDLPGTYSLTSFSPEERVARDFLLYERPDCIVNVVDSSNLMRGLMFTIQALEMERPFVLGCNMMDVAEAHGMRVDVSKLSEILGVQAVPLIGRKNQGREELQEAIRQASQKESGSHPAPLEYGSLEETVQAVTEALGQQQATLGAKFPLRWMAVKLLEGDERVKDLLREHHPDAEAILAQVAKAAATFESTTEASTTDFILACRHERAHAIAHACITTPDIRKATLSERIDRVVLHRVLAPIVLIATVYAIYQLSIVQGYELTKIVWPYLAAFRNFVATILPAPGLVEDSLFRALTLWCIDSANTLLNYVPIFVILFALIAMLEDSGYMARIAFILDRIFQRFGLHGQSTLPFILGGVFAGGCAVPGIMATKGIPDERARLATILTVPYMNCLAKVPLYTLLVNIFFVDHKSEAMLFISTITIFMALIIAWILTNTILKSHHQAPFVMEMPTYHLPTVRGVVTRTYQRVREYIEKVGTIVLAVSICVFALLQFPTLPDETLAQYETKMEEAYGTFQATVATSPFAEQLDEREEVLSLLDYSLQFTAARLNAAGDMEGVFQTFDEKNPLFFQFMKPGKKGKDERAVGSAMATLINTRKEVQRDLRSERIAHSFFGRLGRGLEPVTQFAGFDWKINIALISSFAARESSVATLGVLFQDGAESGDSLEDRMGAESTATGMTPLHALAVILFFALYPPCFATTIMVKVQTGTYKWMLFAIAFPTVIGLAVASSIFMLGNAFQMSGYQMMLGFYLTVVAIALCLGLFAGKRRTTAIGEAIQRERRSVNGG